jgi:hypothetical protein
LANISQQIAKVRHSLDLFYKYPTDSAFVAQEIDEPVASILHTIEILPKTKEVSYLYPLSCALRIFLYLVYPPFANALSSDIANELRDALGEPKIRLCSALNLTVWQFFVGAAAADLHSETRAWYLHRLKRMFVPMHLFDWQAVIAVLEKSFMPPLTLLEEFRHIWEEICTYSSGQK